MTIEEMMELTNDDNNDEHLRFERVDKKLSRHPDIHAFLLLSKLFPDHDGDIVTWAGHDTIAVFPSDEELETLDKKTVVELYRCGFFYSEENGCLTAFV